ncbi:MAG: NUDIX domain-containing protein [Pirellulaceae bacterium]|nr:NUDIX domain-containing protein [Pirellulaceae bacterium]
MESGQGTAHPPRSFHKSHLQQASEEDVKKKPKGKVKAAGIVIFIKKPRCQFLLMRHPDRWDLPKGHCEPKETYLETALRETQEETGIDADAIEVDDSFEFAIEYPVSYKRWGDEVFTKKVKYFLGYLPDQPELTLTEHPSAKWFEWAPPHQIQSQTIDPLLRAIAEHFGSNDCTNED